mgnify:FL=1
MAGELFGTPLGEIALGEKELTQAKSWALMGQLAEVPSKIALQGAQTREQTSLAKTHEAALEKIQLLARIDAAYQAEQTAQEQLAKIHTNRTGTTTTQADIPKGGLTNASLADPLIQKANWMRSKGYPLDTYQPMLEKASLIQEHESIGKFRSAQAEWEQNKMSAAKAKELAETAGAVGASPLSWLAAHDPAQAATLAKLPKELQGMSFDQAKPHLDLIRNQGLGASTTSTIAARAAKAKLDKITSDNDTRKANAYVDQMTTKNKQLKQDLDMEIKLGGDKSQSTKDLRDARTQAQDELTVARQLVTSPYIPVLSTDPKLKIGATFTRKGDNAVLRMTGRNPTTNLPQFEILRQGPITRRGQRKIVEGMTRSEEPPAATPRSDVQEEVPAALEPQYDY